ncbi:MAG: CAP domain-containing protein [Thermoanaerobaculia bacterium]
MPGILSFAFALLAAAAVAGEPPRDITVNSLLSEINRQRLVHRLPPLRLEPRLVRAAELRMRDMEEQRYWDHVDPSGNTPFEWLRVSGYDFELAGENLAQGFESPQILVEAWMESEGHRRNLLAPRYSEAGVAIIDGGTTRRTTGKSVVVVFARERDPRLMPNPRKMPDTP